MALKYIGTGDWIHLVPARDLNDEEETRYGETIKEQEKLTGMTLYKKVSIPKSKPSVAPKPDEVGLPLQPDEEK